MIVGLGVAAMDGGYFERVDREEARHAEWRLLDQALQTRRGGKSEPIRITVGHWLIWAGAVLANETVVSQPKSCCNGR